MSTQTKHDVLAELRRRVLAMELLPGDPVDESALAREFNVSRTPMREIVQRLAGEGYLQLLDQRGARVMPMDIGILRQFFQAAPMIYAAIARLAAEQATPHHLDRLKEVQMVYLQALRDQDSLASAMQNHRFHALVGEMASSPYLLPGLERLLIDHTRIGQTFYRFETAQDRQRIDMAAAQHDAMIAAFEDRAPATAVDITLDHWALSRDRLEAFVSPAPLAHDLELGNAV